MKVSQYNRRNFLSSLAILSVGTAFGSTVKYFSPGESANDLQKGWRNFWKKSGGRIHFSLIALDNDHNRKDTKGHSYKYGEIIYFPKENILAQPVWVFWNGRTKPADVIVTFFENSQSARPVISLNRYEMDALYRLSNEPRSEELLPAFLNGGKQIEDSSTGIIKTKTSIKENSGIQEISYYDGQSLILHKKFIYHA